MPLASFKSLSPLINSFHYVRSLVLLVMLMWSKHGSTLANGKHVWALIMRHSSTTMQPLHTAWHYKTQQATNDMETNQLANKNSSHKTAKPEEKPATLAQLNMFLLSVKHGEMCIHVRLKVHVTTLFKCFHSWEKKKRRKTRQKINAW